MYVEAKKYFAENGDLNVPKSYVTAQGYSLGQWLLTQRRVRAGKTPGNLSDDQIKLLDQIGIRWGSVTDQSWERNYSAARLYYERHGDLLVGNKYETKDGLKLGCWIRNLRTIRKSGIKNNYLTKERIQALNEIGMQWVREHGDTPIPKDYVSETGIKLGKWVYAQQQRYKNGSLSSEYIERLTAIAPHRKLDELGFILGNKHDLAWDAVFQELQRYFKEHGNLNLPFEYTAASGLQLERWLYEQKKAAASGRLKLERRKRLDALDPSWQKPKAPRRVT